MIARLLLLLLLATAAWGQDSIIEPYESGSHITGGVTLPHVQYVPAIVDLQRIHFRELLVQEWRAYQESCKTDSFLVLTGYWSIWVDPTDWDSSGLFGRWRSIPDSAWVRRDPYSFPHFMNWLEKELKP